MKRIRNPKNQMSKSVMICSECGKKGIPILRYPGQARAYNHIKTLWCCNCRKDTKHREIREFDYVLKGMTLR